MVQQLYQKVRLEIDCKICMNCCKELQPVLDEEDTKNIAEGTEITIIQLKKQYLTRTQPENGYIFKEKPCLFLKGSQCTYYKYRPKDCETFPHLSKGGFVFRLIEMIENSSICPLVFNVCELLKEDLWARKKAI
jgi:Fe-S-cluster containining protein